MKGIILSYIIEKMVGMEDAKRFDEFLIFYLELEHYLFAHLMAIDLHQAEAFKALQEVQAEVERVWAEIDRLKVASKIQTVEVKHLWKVSRREKEASTGLRAALALSEDKRKKSEEEEAFLEGFEICMRRVTKNFPGVDLDLLTDEPSEGVDTSNAGAASPIAEPTPSAPKLAIEASESIPEPDIARDVPTSPASASAKNPSNDRSQGPSSPTDAELLSQGIPLKPIVKNLKRKIHHLKKKLKKIEAELRGSRKNASEAMIEKQLHDIELTYDTYRLGWSERISQLEQRLHAANSEVTRLQKQLDDSHQSGKSDGSGQVASLTRTLGELLKAVERKKAEVQRLRIQLSYEQQAVRDAEAESEVLRK
ncbi:hypothetical protein COCNU_scaffold004099G000010 [Cocos nucifera]|nr:hypothetical protein [Cocos nucifera]